MPRIRIVKQFPNHYGYHVTSEKGLLRGIRDAKKLGASAVQIFLKTPHPGKGAALVSKMTREDAQKIRGVRGVKLFVHSAYYINFAKSPNSGKNAWILKAYLDDLEKAQWLGVVGCVIHMGKTNTKSEGKIPLDQAKENTVVWLKKTIEKMGDNPTRILLETSTGQGSEMCTKIEELAEIYNGLSSDEQARVGFCVDTCHIFAAGYDISKPEQARKYFETFDEQIGIGKIKLIHLNDSKDKCHSNLDHHEVIGDGHIGADGISEVIKIANRYNIPMVLEKRKEIQKQMEFIAGVKN